MFKKSILIVLISGLVFVISCKEKKQEEGAAKTEVTAETGKAKYDAIWVPCHGLKGAGDGPAGAALNPKPRNFSKDGFKFGKDLAAVKKSIGDGISGTGMTGYKGTLSPEELEAVAKYVMELAGNK